MLQISKQDLLLVLEAASISNRGERLARTYIEFPAAQ
jgi:hypothetical protein